MWQKYIAIYYPYRNKTFSLLHRFPPFLQNLLKYSNKEKIVWMRRSQHPSFLWVTKIRLHQSSVFLYLTSQQQMHTHQVRKTSCVDNLVAELVGEGGDGVLTVGQESTNGGTEPGNHGETAVVDLLVLVSKSILLRLVIELGEGSGIGLDITGDLVLLLGGKDLEGRAEEEDLSPSKRSPGTGGDGIDTSGHGGGDTITSGDETGELDTKTSHEGVEHGKHSNTAVLDLDGAVAVELLDITISGEAKGIPVAKRSGDTSLVLEGHAGNTTSAAELGGRGHEGRGTDEASGKNSGLHFDKIELVLVSVVCMMEGAKGRGSR
jgi:hypothetical protein